MFGLWKIKKLSGKDSSGASNMADVESCMNAGVEGEIYLPPYLRPNQCKIQEGAIIWGVVDEITGKGAAFAGIDDADYGYFFDADCHFKRHVNIDKNLNIEGEAKVKGDVNTDGKVIASGDVQGKGISLSTHFHPTTQPGSPTGTPTPSSP